MVRLLRSTAVLLCAGLLASCSASTSDSSDSPASTATETAQVTPSLPATAPDNPVNKPVIDVPSDTSVLKASELRPQGANAAPGLPGATTQIYDNSQLARKDFFAWWSYELQVPQDIREESALYEAGITVCVSRARGAGVTAIETVLNGEMGYTLSGASAITRAALAALCPMHDLGYRTYFDRNVLSFSYALKPLVTFNRQPYDYEFGFFMKEVCAAMAVDRIGGQGIYAHITGLIAANHFTLTGSSVPVDVVYIMINESVKAGCPAFTTQLPPVIQLST